RLDLASPDTVPESYGSGVVIHESGLVLTNFHVIEKAKKVFVRLPGPDRASYADILAADPRADLAVLKLIRGPGDLKPIKFGDGGKVRKGDWVISLANPFAAGFRDGSPSASWGIISNLRRPAPPPGPVDEAKRAKPLAQYAFLIQTDARLNLGCSGGALLNLDGELIGLSTALAARTGGEAAGGYAIPMDANVKKMIEVLKRGEEIEYGFLGVTIPSDARSDSFGVEIGGVAPGMPAARAGLIAQDTIVAINGNPVRDHDDLFLHISAALAGSEADIEVRRNGTTRTFRARLAKAPPGEWADKAIASNRPKSVYGIRVDYASTMSLDSNPPEGVLVKDLEPGSPAEKKLKEWSARARLIVIAVDGKPVPTPADFYRAAAGKGSVTLDVIEATSRDADPKRERVTLP
ncbi:MAG TPA: trypsin-like peptidase domain-containing protein, partial [Gemmataceae bacterium]|nr:trypsin-like peptidase domain-containing protein [Gemmataceae bacterium]